MTLRLGTFGKKNDFIIVLWNIHNTGALMVNYIPLNKHKGYMAIDYCSWLINNFAVVGTEATL